MASIDSSVYSRDLSDAESTSTQQQPTDLTVNSDAHDITSLQIWKRVDHSQDETDINQGQDDGIGMYTHLPRDVRSLQAQTDLISPKTSKNKFPGNLMTFSEPQDQARFALGNDPHPYQPGEEDSVHVPWPQTPARSAITHQIAEASMQASNPEALVGSTFSKDVSNQQLSHDSARIHLLQPRGPPRSTGSDQSIQNHQLASSLMNTSHFLPQVGSHLVQESNDGQFYQLLMDISHPTRPQMGSYQAEDAHKQSMPQMPSNMYCFEPQIGSYRNQYNFNSQLPQMAAHMSRSQDDIDQQESHNRQLAHFSMKMPHLEPQIGIQEMRKAHHDEFARIPMNASKCQPRFEFSQVLEAPICDVDQISMNKPPKGAQTNLLHSQDIYNRQLNHASKSMRQPRDRMEPPRIQEVLNHQMALFATTDVHSDWQSGLRAGSRPAFWDQCSQTFGISQHVQPEPSARNMPSDFCTGTTLIPQLHLGPDGRFRSQQFGALQGWPSSFSEGARVDPLLNPPLPPTPEMKAQVVLPSNSQRAAYQSIDNQGQLNQWSERLAPSPIGSTRPAMDMLPRALKPPSLPPIGTPRASGPKLTTAAPERKTGQSQPTDTEPTLPSLPYYPGSDVMYPYAKQNPSEALRLLTAHGRPSIDTLLDRDIVPFMKGDEKCGAVDWGVIRIGNVSVPSTAHHLSCQICIHMYLASLPSCRTGPIILQLPTQNR